MQARYDYIVVGAGSAGCAVAGRLSADPNVSVALIEAGGKDTSPWVHIPVGYFKTMGNPKTDWCYQTQPDPNLNNRSLNWPRGKLLGGSSSINGLLYVRGQPQDFDEWRQLGNSGWGWEDVLPHFKAAEHWEGSDTDNDTNNDGDKETNERGTGGPLHVAPNRVKRYIVDAWLESAVASGYQWTEDYNRTDQSGISHFQMTMRGGWRCSSAVAYLRPARQRRNLTIITHAHAHKILIKQNRAIGVRLKQKTATREIFAKREIIISSGAINSPQLLMLSGVGDGRQLQNLGIETQVDLPGVGRNLQDHLQARPIYQCSTTSTINTEIRNPLRLVGMALQYAWNRTGPMAMAVSLGTGFIKSHDGLSRPDLQFHIQPFSADNPAEGTHKFSAFTASVLQLRPESRGHIALTSPDPDTPPAIHPNYLAEQIDCDTLVAGIKITRKISATPPVSHLITGEYTPGETVKADDDEAILKWARETATTIYHPTGTCKMGREGDKFAVLDSRLRVRGVKGLRVADASIMPNITSGNTNAPAIMIGEKCAAMVKEDWRG
ncbi:MAG: GMC family oxidoreductase N-terminal domain-containing protein [Proteobacteria bacterium]|nr:GMC family oxidoreductase N-terminal domain-containing protein [Pseudomonadota bacterium]